ncbi:hypothetical protein AB0I68_22115 [Streptomyces sp. NPDC050448]|uniref:hypothetical protein n=1 Tax=Streptomyces sp. NPDC050448 TaxID=3155404 RepID=UPI003435F45F
MRPTRTAVLLTAGLVTLLGVPAQAAAGTPATLYVNNVDANCSDAGAGAQTVPFCTVSAAARVVQPGQTVRIKAGRTYDEAVTVDRSGEPGRPITFVADPSPLVHQAEVSKGLAISGAGHVVVRELSTHGGVRVGRSADVELDRLTSARYGLDSVVVGEGSTDVRVTRSRLSGVRIEGGARGTVLSRNLIGGTTQAAVTVVDAPGTAVTNNTAGGYCAATVSVGGGSGGSAVFNVI